VQQTSEQGGDEILDPDHPPAPLLWLRWSHYTPAKKAALAFGGAITKIRSLNLHDGLSAGTFRKL